MRNSNAIKWTHIAILTFIGALLVILPMASPHRISLQNLQTVGMMSFGAVLLLTAMVGIFQLQRGMGKTAVAYIVLLVLSIMVLLYCGYYVYDFNRSRGDIPIFISVFIWSGVVLSSIIIFRELGGVDKR
jgi:hypothetical protein